MSGYSVRGGSGYALSAVFSTSSWEPARLATTADVAVLAGGAPSTADGVNVALNDRILVRAQNALPTNGIYVVTTVGGGANGTWVRAADASSSNDFTDGKTIGVGQGVTLADTLWQLTSNAPFTLGVSNVVFIQDANSGWVHDIGPPATERLATATDQVAIGTATPTTGRKVTILTTGVNQGLRVNTTATTDNVLDVLNNAEANRTFALNGLGVAGWGPGGAAAQDTRLQRSAAGTLALDDTAAGIGTLVGGADNRLNIGTAALRNSQLFSVNYYVINAASDAQAIYQMNTAGFAGGAGGNFAVDVTLSRGAADRWTCGLGDSLETAGTGVHAVRNALADANPTAQLGTTALKLGINSADNLSARFYASANKTLTIDDGAAGAATLSVLGTTITQARTIQTVFGSGTPYTVSATDDFVGRNATGGPKGVTLLAATTGRRITIKNTGSANTVTVTPNLVETIDGAATVALTTMQRVTIVGLAGTGWFVI